MSHPEFHAMHWYTPEKTYSLYEYIRDAPKLLVANAKYDEICFCASIEKTFIYTSESNKDAVIDPEKLKSEIALEFLRQWGDDLRLYFEFKVHAISPGDKSPVEEHISRRSVLVNHPTTWFEPGSKYSPSRINVWFQISQKE